MRQNGDGRSFGRESKIVQRHGRDDYLLHLFLQTVQFHKDNY